MGLFRQKPRPQFLCEPADEGAIPPPVSAKAYLPDWFRKLPAVDETRLASNGSGLTVNRCMPFLKMTTGWIIPLAATVRKIREGGTVMEAGWDSAAAKAEVETEIRAETKDEAGERERVLRQTMAKTGWYRTNARAMR